MSLEERDRIREKAEVAYAAAADRCHHIVQPCRACVLLEMTAVLEHERAIGLRAFRAAHGRYLSAQAEATSLSAALDEVAL